MPRFRTWLRSHLFSRHPTNTSKTRSTWRQSLLISAPVPIGALTIDLHSNPLSHSLSAQDLTEPHPLHYSRRMSADFAVPPSIDVILEESEPEDSDSEPGLPLPPSALPLDTHASLSPITIDAVPAARPRPATRNFSRRFSARFSTLSTHSRGSSKRSSVASLGSEGKRLSQLSAGSGATGEEWEGGARLSRQWSNRVSGVGEYTRMWTPMNVIG